MKKTILTLVMALFAITVFAQNESKVRVPSGYQGFLEQGNTWHFDKNMPNSISLSTTHGFYFNGHIYAGVGVGIDFNNDNARVPFYSNVRYVFNNDRIVSPVLSLRVGSFLGDNMGAYGDLAFGVRFASKRDFAVNAMIAGTYYDKISDDAYINGNYQAVKMSPSGISLRIGIEW